MTLTDKHIENAHVCARLELAGASVNKIAKECGVTRATIWNWSKDPAFRAEKARARAAFRVDLSDIPPKISTVNFPEVAKRNMADLAAIERELFAVTFSADAPGKLVLVQPRYWDLQADGTTPGFLREPRIGPGVGASGSGPTSGGA